jgi:type II secretory pathway pseudopilin PulG
MIVVVIMAILVAVAVPIFSAVTKNARTKTCLANQREIQSQFNNAEMSSIIVLKTGDKFTLETNATGDNGTWTADSANTGTTDATAIQKLFQKAPYCPVKGNKIEVTIETVTMTADQVGYKVSTVCTSTTGEAHNAATAQDHMVTLKTSFHR